MPLYQKDNYHPTEGITLGSFNKTETSKNQVPLIKYKKENDTYNKYNIVIEKETNRLAITGTFSKNDKVKIILDKFLGKKTYDFIISTRPYTAMCVDTFNNNKEEKLTLTKYINNTTLNGKYSIYIYINGTVYKTNYYVTF